MTSECKRHGVCTYPGSDYLAPLNQLLALLLALTLLTLLPQGAFAGSVYIGTTPYGSFQSAYAAATTGAVLKSQPMVYFEGLLLNRALDITVQGGYDPVSGVLSGSTTMNGPLTVKSGSIKVSNLIISGINASVFVPNVIGTPLSTVQATLVASGVTLGSVSSISSASVPSGYIISQIPVAGAFVLSGIGVNLVVSSGANVVPNFVGQTQAAATAAITSAGLTVGTITLQSSATVPAGSVISQSPAAGTALSPGTVMLLTVSNGAAGSGVIPPVITPLPSAETTPGNLVGTSYVVFAWNDLGMHCLNPSYDTAVILPPYNTVRAQVIKRGNKPVVVTSGLTVSYRIINNTTSQKGLFSQFWTYAQQLFGATPALDHGLNLDDPTVSNGLTGTMLAKTDTLTATPYFIASGIPVTPLNDGLPTTWNPYQVIEVTVKDSVTGVTLAQTRATVPTSDEINCGKCHGHSSDPTTVFNNVLATHDAKIGTNLIGSKPVRCSSCHASPVLGAPLNPGIKYLSEAIHGFHSTLATPPNCYDCHPGVVTQCNRSTKHTAADGNCTTCHGTLATVASSITSGARLPWVNEPKCMTCHNTNNTGGTGVAQVDTGTTLYRNSVGHSGVFCSACHGSPHSMTPSNQASDNYQAIQYQGVTALTGVAAAIGDCRNCHMTSRGGGTSTQFSIQHAGTGATLSACAVCHTDFTNAANVANWPHQFQWKSR